MSTWPVRGQRGPQHWDDQLKAYIDAIPGGMGTQIEALEDATTDLAARTSAVETTLVGRLSEAQLDDQIALGVDEQFALRDLPKPLDYLRARLARTAMGPVRAMIFGSSTPLGTGATMPAKGMTEVLTRLIQSAYPSGVAAWEPPVLASSVADDYLPNLPGFHMANSAFGGATSGNYVSAAQITQASNIQPHVIFHFVGANDYRNDVSPNIMRSNIITAMGNLDAALTQPAVHIVIGSYAMPVETAPVAPWANYLTAYQQAVDTHPLGIFIDASKPFIRASASGPSAPDPLDLIGTDAIHATDAGHALLAREIAAALGLVEPKQRTPEVLDRFVRKTLASAETNQPWAQLGGGVHVPDGTYLTATTAGNAGVDTGFSDAEVSAIVTFSATAMLGIMAKANADASQRLFFGIHPTLGAGSTPVLVLYKATTLLSTMSITALGPVAGREYHLRLAATGSLVKCFFDGAEAFSVTLDGTDTTTYNANTRHGVRCNAVTNAKWRNFSVSRL